MIIRLYRILPKKRKSQSIERKLQAAKSDLLYSRLEIKEIAAKYGFADVPHFTRRFRQITGTTPGQIRKK